MDRLGDDVRGRRERFVHRLLLLPAAAELAADVALEALVHELGRPERGRVVGQLGAAGRSRRRRGRRRPRRGSGRRRSPARRDRRRSGPRLRRAAAVASRGRPAGDRVPRVDHVGVQVGRGEHGVHALELPRGRCVDPHDPGPGERAPHEAGVEHPRPGRCRRRRSRPGEQAPVLHPVDPGPRVPRGCRRCPRIHAERLFSVGPGGGQATCRPRLRILHTRFCVDSGRWDDQFLRRNEFVSGGYGQPRFEGEGAAVLSSYASGISEVPLIGRTIGEDLAATVARVPRPRGRSSTCPTGRRWTYRELERGVDRSRAALLAAGIAKGDRVGIWSPNCAEWVFVQYATARIGAILVNINPAYRSHELQYVLHQSGIRLLVAAPSFKTSRLRGDDRGGARRVPAARDGRAARTRGQWDDLVARGRRRRRATLERPRGDAGLRRRDQHPVHVGHDRVPEGRDAVAPQHPEQRLLRRSAARLHRAGPGVRARALLPLLRDGDGQPRCDLARRRRS